MTTHEILLNAAELKGGIATLTSDRKNEALFAMADAIEKNASAILSENEKDIEAARGSISDVMIDRLRLNEARVADMANGIRSVAALPDPVGRVLEKRVTADGLDLVKVSVPVGVVAIIYESRPNVTSDAAALCLKSGNVCVLRGGKEACRTSAAVVRAMREGLETAHIPAGAINMLEDTTRQGSYELMKAHGLVDLLIPRGGAGLIRACVENATVPCIETGTGICSVYVDADADPDMALRIVENAKTQRPSVCNAEETLLVHRDIAESFLPRLQKRLCDDRAASGLQPVELRLCPRAAEIIPGVPAGDADFDTEFLDYILAVKVVDGVEEAVDHIRRHSTHHSEAVITKNEAVSAYFTANVDSAAVYVNASTRFTDGGMFGLGCEMGISTQKLHARGPMGLQELNSYKYVVRGSGQVRKA